MAACTLAICRVEFQQPEVERSLRDSPSLAQRRLTFQTPGSPKHRYRNPSHQHGQVRPKGLYARSHQPDFPKRVRHVRARGHAGAADAAGVPGMVRYGK